MLRFNKEDRAYIKLFPDLILKEDKMLKKMYSSACLFKHTIIRTLGISVGLGIIIPLLLTACSTVRLTSVWKEQSYQGHPKKIMVIGVAKRPINRRIFEDEFVRQLKARGTDAFASYTVLSDDKKNDNAAIAEKMKEQGADTVLVTRLVSKKTVKFLVPGTAYYPPARYPPWHDHYPPYYGTWRDYYGFGYQSMYTPGYIAEDEYALMETNLYNAGNDNLIWSALSESEILGADQALIREYVSIMVNALTDQNILK